MPTRRTTEPSSEAVSRRLSLLSAELAAVRDPAPDDWPPSLPSPGRHAARPTRPNGSAVAAQLAERMPDTLRGRVRLSSTHLVLIAGLVLAAVAASAWWASRSSPGDGLPVTLQSPSATPVEGLATPAESPSASTADTGTVVVDVTGAVRRPGIVVLDAGARVVDALEAAGGPRKGVRLSNLNQARVLVDGEQIVVGGQPVPGVAASGAPAVPSSAAGPATLVNINTATEGQLDELPGVGPVTAQAILDWRAENGAFTSVDELLEVDGIGAATLADLAPYVTI